MTATSASPDPLVDHHEITQLAISYCWALDQHQWHELDDVFLPDATASLGGRECADREAIKSVIENALGPLDDSQHIVSNHQIRVDGDTATARCYLHAQHVLREAEGGPHWIVAGRYEDECVRTDEGWRIKRRDLIVMWTEGNPGVSRRKSR